MLRRARRRLRPLRAGRVRLDDHAARPLREHRLERLAEHGRAAARRQRHARSRAPAARAPPRRSAARAWPARTFSQCPVTRRPPCSRACSMIVCAACSCSGIAALIGDRGRDDDRDQHVDPAPAPRGDLDGGRDGARRVVRGVERDEHRLVLGLVGDDRRGDRDLTSSSGPGHGGGGRTRRRASRREPGDAGDRDVDVQGGHDDEREARADPAEDREHRDVEAARCAYSPARGRARRRRDSGSAGGSPRGARS